MHNQVGRLQELLKKISDTVVVARKTNVTAEQVLKAEDINLAEGATLNIQMNQFVVDKNTEQWLDEAMQIAKFLSQMIPNGNRLEFSEAVKNYKLGLIRNAMIEYNNDQGDVVRALKIPRSSLKHYLKQI